VRDGARHDRQKLRIVLILNVPLVPEARGAHGRSIRKPPEPTGRSNIQRLSPPVAEKGDGIPLNVTA
jgi:hypothetical protein